MQTYPEEWTGNIRRNIAFRIYLSTLNLYPKSFRDRFGSEMEDVFQEALDEHVQKGRLNTLIFIGRELIEAPGSILNQHLSLKSFWVRPFPMNILAFTFGFILLGLSDGLKYSLRLAWAQSDWFDFLSLIFIGSLVSLALGSSLNPHRKRLFTLCGAVGFLLANTLVKQTYFNFFPDAFTAPSIGIYFLLPFLCPLLTGSVFGLFIGAASGTLRSLFQWIGWGGLVLLAGFFVNRVSASLMQSYFFHSPNQDIVQIGMIGFLMPYLFEGILLGILFGGITQRHISVRA
jgi:hypothetical protein